MKATSKLISVVLILAMCLSMFTVSAFAAPSQVVIVPMEGNELTGNPNSVYEGGSYTGRGYGEADNADTTATPNVAAPAASVPTVATVSTAAELAAAVTNGGDIQLANDIVVNAPLVFNATTTLDLKGHVLRFENGSAAQGTALNSAAAVVVKNGAVSVSGGTTVTNSGTVNTGFQSVASGVTFNNTNVSFNAPDDWSIFGTGVGLIYGSYNRDVSAWVNSAAFDVVNNGGAYVVTDKAPVEATPAVEAAPAVEPAAEEVTEEPAAEEVTEEPAAEEVAEEPAAEEVTEEPAAEEVTEEPAAEEVTEEPASQEAAVELEEPAAESQADEQPVEEASGEGNAEDAAPAEDAGEEAEDNTAEVDVAAAEDAAQTEENAAEGEEGAAEAEPAEGEIPASDEQLADESLADMPVDETPVDVVEEEEKTYEEEVRVSEEEEADESDVVTLTGVDEATGAVVVISGKNLPEGLTVVVKPLSNDVIGGLEEGERAVLALDISLVDAEGNEYEPKDDPNVGAVSVQIKHASLGNLEEDETLALYHIVDDVAQTVGSAEGEDDSLNFATNSFSPFVITAKTGKGTVYTGSDGEVHKKSISIKNITGDIYVIGDGSKDLKFEISGGAIPESISIIDPENVSSGNAAIYKAGYLIYDTDYTVNYDFSKDPPDPIPDPLTVTIKGSAIKNAPTGKWAVVFWFKDTTDSGSTRVYLVQYVTIVPKAEIKALLPVDSWGDYYFNKCSYAPMEFFLTAELDKLTLTEKSTGKTVASYDYSSDKKHITVTANNGSTKSYNLNEMLEVSDYVTYDAVSHEYIAGKSLKLFSNLIRKLNFGEYTIHIWQKNHASTAEANATDKAFTFTLQPGITVADGLNDYIKGKNLWIKFQSCWPIDYDSDGTLAIWIGGQKIGHEYYSISNDHQTLWIYRNLLDQLRSNNSYTLTARLWKYDNKGVKQTFYPATASFNILAAGSTSYKSPKTGDNSNVALWAAVLVLSGGAVVALIPKKKKLSK